MMKKIVISLYGLDDKLIENFRQNNININEYNNDFIQKLFKELWDTAINLYCIEDYRLDFLLYNPELIKELTKNSLNINTGESNVWSVINLLNDYCVSLCFIINVLHKEEFIYDPNDSMLEFIEYRFNSMVLNQYFHH